VLVPNCEGVQDFSLFLFREHDSPMNDLNRLSAISMAQQVPEKQISPVELIEAHLAQIERLNPKLNAFVHLDADRARHDARAAEAAVMKGEALGPLHGVPISIKSSIDLASGKRSVNYEGTCGRCATPSTTIKT